MYLGPISQVKQLTVHQVIGKAPGGGDLVVGAGDGGAVPPEAMPERSNQSNAGTQDLAGVDSQVAPGVGQIGFGSSAPAVGPSGVGEPMGIQGLPGHDVPAKR